MSMSNMTQNYDAIKVCDSLVPYVKQQCVVESLIRIEGIALLAPSVMKPRQNSILFPQVRLHCHLDRLNRPLASTQP